MNSKLCRPFVWVLCTTIMCWLVGCGGGTRGTGTNVSGRVLANAEQGFARVYVDRASTEGILVIADVIDGMGRIVESATSETDGNGEFTMFLSRLEERVEFQFSSSTIDSSTILNGVPTNSREINVNFSISESGEVAIVDFDFFTLEQDLQSSSEESLSALSEEESQKAVSDNVPSTGVDFEDSDQLEEKEAEGSGSVENESQEESNGEQEAPLSDQEMEGQDLNQATDSPGNSESPPEFFLICHGPSQKQKTLTLPETAVQAHLDHGDTLGACE